MNELLSLISTQSRLVITSSGSDSSTDVSSDAICIEVPTDDIRVGDSLLVFPGETIPVDGRVVAGRSVVDESMLTRESLPVFNEKGVSVSAGTINWVWWFKDSINQSNMIPKLVGFRYVNPLRPICSVRTWCQDVTCIDMLFAAF